MGYIWFVVLDKHRGQGEFRYVQVGQTVERYYCLRAIVSWLHDRGIKVYKLIMLIFGGPRRDVWRRQPVVLVLVLGVQGVLYPYDIHLQVSLPAAQATAVFSFVHEPSGLERDSS